MNEHLVEDEHFENLDFTKEALPKGDYECCSFKNCDFSNLNLSGFNFTECEFIDSNLSGCKLLSTSFKDVKFINSKLLGLHFDTCNSFLFEIYLEGSQVNLSSFYNVILKKTSIKNCQLKEVDFTGADLSEAILESCDLTGAKFERTNLEKTDFRTSYAFQIDPELNSVKGAKFSLTSIAGLLSKYDLVLE